MDELRRKYPRDADAFKIYPTKPATRGAQMFFTVEQVNQLAEGYAAVDDRYEKLRQAYIDHPWTTDRGREFGVNGFVRRLQCLHRCVRNVFENLPPELEHAPDRDTRHEAELQVQAFIFRAFGAADNLAWICAR